ncbi:MAG: PD-(D/E)XK nuclease family protein [Chloroflexi bacterium]|nr:MAG: PD-(D/E)XK nuclease family protein [Chloroflexota bacterium]
MAVRPRRAHRRGGAARVRRDDARPRSRLPHVRRRLPAPGGTVGFPRHGRPRGRGARAHARLVAARARRRAAGTRGRGSAGRPSPRAQRPCTRARGCAGAGRRLPHRPGLGRAVRALWRRQELSPTTLNDYLKCPRLYWYNHHPGLVEEPRSVAMERGGFLHEVLQDFHEHEADWRQLETEQQRAWFEDLLSRHIDGYLSRMEAVLDRKREEKQVRSLLANYIRSITGMQFIRRLGTLAVEKRFHLELDGVEVVGKIDRVNDVGDGEVEVVDYKTGAGKNMRIAYEMYFGPELHDVQLALYYLACRYGFDDEGRPLGFQPRFLSLWYPKDWVWGGMRQDIFSVGRPAGLKEYRERPLTEEDLERSRAVVMTAIERIKTGHFEPAPREIAGTCVTRFGSCPHAAICSYGGAPPE